MAEGWADPAAEAKEHTRRRVFAKACICEGVYLPGAKQAWCRKQANRTRLVCTKWRAQRLQRAERCRIAFENRLENFSNSALRQRTQSAQSTSQRGMRRAQRPKRACKRRPTRSRLTTTHASRPSAALRAASGRTRHRADARSAINSAALRPRPLAPVRTLRVEAIRRQRACGRF